MIVFLNNSALTKLTFKGKITVIHNHLKSILSQAVFSFSYSNSSLLLIICVYALSPFIILLILLTPMEKNIMQRSDSLILHRMAKVYIEDKYSEYPNLLVELLTVEKLKAIQESTISGLL